MASIYRLGHNWRAQVRLAGQPSRSAVFKTKAEAIRWARAEEANKPSDLKDGGRPYTVAMAFDGYVSTLANIGKTKEQNLRNMQQVFGHYRLAELKAKHVIDFAKARLTGQLTFVPENLRPTKLATRRTSDEAKPSTVMMNLTHLSVVLKYAMTILGSQDAADAHLQVQRAIATLRHGRMVGDSEKRSRRPTEQELLALEDYFDSRKRLQIPMTDIMHFAICTTMRQGEIIKLQWEEFNADNRTIWIRGRKDPRTNKGRDDLVPLITGPVTINGVLISPIDIIMRQKTAKRKTGRIFPYAGRSISDAFLKATEALKIPDLRFHDLRHEGISRLFEHKYQIPEVALISGHQSWKNLQRYTQIEPTSLHKPE